MHHNNINSKSTQKEKEKVFYPQKGFRDKTMVAKVGKGTHTTLQPGHHHTSFQLCPPS